MKYIYIRKNASWKKSYDQPRQHTKKQRHTLPTKVHLAKAMVFPMVTLLWPHGVFQARILEWVAISSSRGSSWPRDQTDISCVFCIGRWLLYHCATWEALSSRALSKYHTALNVDQMSQTASCTVESKDARNTCVLLKPLGYMKI